MSRTRRRVLTVKSLALSALLHAAFVAAVIVRQRQHVVQGLRPNPLPAARQSPARR